jgi:endonuclease/exonuclease/phosphatase family metal-dependent hydrolase
VTSTPLRLLSWNIRQGGGSRLRRQVDVIAGVEPDVVALQEVVATTAPRYRELLAAAGLAYFADSFSVAPDPSQLVGARRYGLLVLSRWSVDSITDVPVRMPWPERLLSTRIRTPFGAVEVHTAHIPPGASHRWLKIETFEGIYERLTQPCPDPRILCGDFNSPQDELETGEVITWGQVIHKNGSIAMVRHRDATSPGRWDAGERSIVAGLVAHGFQDAYRTVHGYSTREYSWVLARKTGGVRRRFDHIFASTELRPVACRYLHEARQAGQSDHSPMLADLDCGPLSADGSRSPGRRAV